MHVVPQMPLHAHWQRDHCHVTATHIKPDKLTIPNIVVMIFICKECHVRYLMKAFDTLVINHHCEMY